MTHLYLGIDIGGTKIKAVLLRGLNKHRVQLVLIDTPKNKKKLLFELEKLTQSIVGEKRIAGIGVGIAGVVDGKRGILLRAQNLPFMIGWEAKKFFRKFGRRVLVDNDSRCFLRGEAFWGAAQGYKNVIALTIGTGIGGGIIIDGKMYHGAHNAANEFGKMVIDRGRTLEELGAKRAFAKLGDRSRTIGVGVANLINAFDPDMVVLGGGGVISGRVKFDIVRRVAKIWSPRARKTHIVKGKLGESAGAIGAALLLGKGA